MRKLIFFMHVSLDGFVAGPNGEMDWIKIDDAMFDFVNNISSVNGKIATPFVGAYVASKHAVEGFSHSLRRELLMYDIDVVIVAPGPVQTPIWDKGMDITGYENSAYYSAFKKMTTYLSSVKHKALTIESISKTILNIFEKEKPRTRYALLNGKFANWTIPRLLPDRVLDNIFGKQLGFKK